MVSAMALAALGPLYHAGRMLNAHRLTRERVNSSAIDPYAEDDMYDEEDDVSGRYYAMTPESESGSL